MYRLIDVYLADCRMYVYYCKAFQVSKINPTIIGYCSITDIVTVYVFCEKKNPQWRNLVISILFLIDQLLGLRFLEWHI